MTLLTRLSQLALIPLIAFATQACGDAEEGAPHAASPAGASAEGKQDTYAGRLGLRAPFRSVSNDLEENGGVLAGSALEAYALPMRYDVDRNELLGRPHPFGTARRAEALRGELAALGERYPGARPKVARAYDVISAYEHGGAKPAEAIKAHLGEVEGRFTLEQYREPDVFLFEIDLKSLGNEAHRCSLLLDSAARTKTWCQEGPRGEAPARDVASLGRRDYRDALVRSHLDLRAALERGEYLGAYAAGAASQHEIAHAALPHFVELHDRQRRLNPLAEHDFTYRVASGYGSESARELIQGAVDRRLALEWEARSLGAFDADHAATFTPRFVPVCGSFLLGPAGVGADASRDLGATYSIHFCETPNAPATLVTVWDHGEEAELIGADELRFH